MKNLVTVQSIICMYAIHLRLKYCAVIRGRNNNGNCDTEEGQLRSFLWTIKREPPSYLFGTIHVPYTRVWDYIPENVKTAFYQSENVFFELDLTNPTTVTQLANCQLLPHGEILSDILPKALYARLKDHFEYVRARMSKWITEDQKGKGLYADYLFDIIAGNWERKRPIWVMLLVNSLTESDIKSREIPVLDLYLAQEAERLDKSTGAVEQVEEQCFPLNDLNYSQVLFALNRTLRQHEWYRVQNSAQNSAIPFSTDDLIHHYNCGDLNGIIFNKDSSQVSNLVNASLPLNDIKTAKIIDQYFRTELINKRNGRMAERVAKFLQDNPDQSFFFAFGAGHFLGNHTVIERLREKGLEIEHTHQDFEVPKTKMLRSYKSKRRNKLQEDFGDLWEEMDPESRSWLEKSRSERRKSYNNNKPFNDLWIRRETPSHEFLQQAPAVSTASIQSAHYLYSPAVSVQPSIDTGILVPLLLLLMVSMVTY